HPVSAHAEAVICDDPAHCCALADLDALAVGWGTSGQDYAARIVAAVEATAGEILTCEGEPIMAVFHAMSAKQTNSAADVWGGAVDYLVSVAAPESEEEPERYRDSAIFSAAEFRTHFLAKHPEATLDLQSPDWFSSFDYAESGLLRSVCVGGVRVSGQELRSLCGLRSAAMTITQGTDRIRFDTVGYGHGVGMSQHGAKILAQQGLSYRAILAHYYVGCELDAAK
ncbi:MAG: SpoIID/LytB domain-containing protein, partial [Clostridia bacterium]|nr:SpoIID/LytB domain-containing protein [Clostridia bacterium]